MRFGIVINMDYGHHPHEMVSSLFRQIRTALEANGFRLDGRVFSTTLSGTEAARLARLVLEEVDAQQSGHDGSLFLYIKEFYGFDIGTVKNLLLPETTTLAVEEYDPTLVIEEIHLAAI